MTEQEIIEAFAELSQIISDLGLGWILVQVNEQIQQGKKPIPKEVQTFKEEWSPESGQNILKPAGKSKMLVAEDYSNTERLLLLISAIEQTVTSATAMRREIINFFTTEGNRNGGINVDVKLYQPLDETSTNFSERFPERDLQASSDLVELLEQLRTEITQ